MPRWSIVLSGPMQNVLRESPVAQRGDSELVLHALREAGRFSVWDMDDKHICAAVMGLQRAGRIRTDPNKFGFPWTAVEIVEPKRRRKLSERSPADEGGT